MILGTLLDESEDGAFQKSHGSRTRGKKLHIIVNNNCKDTQTFKKQLRVNLTPFFVDYFLVSKRPFKKKKTISKCQILTL